MKNVHNWYRGWKLATKHFLFLFCVTFLLFVILAWNNLNEAQELFRKQVISDSQVLVGRTNQLVDSYLDNIQSILLLISQRDDLLLPGHEAEAVGTLREYAENNISIVRTLYLIRADHRVFANTQAYYDILGNPHLQWLYRLALDNYGAINVSPLYNSPLSGKTMAYTMPVKNDAGQTLGVALIEIDLDKLTNSIAPLLTNEHQTFTVISHDNRVVTKPNILDKFLPVDPYKYPVELEESFVGRLGEMSIGVSSIKGLKDEPLVVVKSGENRFGWSLIVFIEESYFYENLVTLYNNYSTAAVFWLFVLLLTSFLMSRYFTNPVRKLVAKMERVRDFNVLSRVTINRDDEIGQLAKSYNMMMDRIHQMLLETKEMEARKNQYELKMLQSQITPHFLYNTLACISSLAKQQKIAEVRETIKSLVGLLSFSFDKSSALVSVNHELQGLQMYLQIQRIRYEDKLTLHIDVANEALHCQILKLTLQPLIENAIFHGLVPRGTEGRITIKGTVSDGKLRLFIRDNGVGMPRSKLADLLTHHTGQPSQFRFTGLGVINVHERIRLYYGNSYGLRIASKINVGTVVRVEMPCMPLENAELEADRGEDRRQPHNQS
ncbi:sensor histidine kinase [Paenibacillus cymbidii]|uniref:sensor histidine kinase n=1 Tax=Paenibacillus cymbidii TaxID=1639034 RepID=UPI001080E19D|nr:sensor histidine kinase [Paenibacillus cymbidii]